MSESAKLHGCLMEGLVPLGTRGVSFGTLKVPIGTLKVLNGSWPRHDFHAMVGRLRTLFQCMF